MVLSDSPMIQDFYDKFSTHLLRDYLIPNRRVVAQVGFFRDAIPQSVRNVLVIGCGTGQGAKYIASNIARQAHVLAVDISPGNLEIARALFSHRRVEYRCVDILSDPLEGTWDVIVFPDVYEHIPAERRSALHNHLADLLDERGMVILTYPSPGHQARLYELGEGLQPVDETVTPADMLAMADDLGATLSHLAMVSAFRVNDYVHVVLQRGCERVYPLAGSGSLRIKRQTGSVSRRFALIFGHCGLAYWPWRRLRSWLALRSIPRVGRGGQLADKSDAQEHED